MAENTPSFSGGFVTFFSEFIKRFGLETPTFFKILMYVGTIAAFVGYIPEILITLSITPGEIFSHYLQIVLKVAGIVTILVSKLTVNNATAVISVSNKLPFTENKKAIGTDKSPEQTAEDLKEKPEILPMPNRDK